MKKVLYLTNIEVPYRVRFFNELSNHCDLTVLYEKHAFEARNKTWAQSAENQHKRRYLRNEHIVFSGILKEIRGGYDSIIIGCYNSPVQIIAMLFMRLKKIPFIINLDGEPFLEGNSLKTKIKKWVLSGAEKYLVAGEKSAQLLQSFVGNKEVIPYYFSSLSEKELEAHCVIAEQCKRNNTILVVGQYFDYKGMDIALEAARLDQSIQYKFVGMGSRTEQFLKDYADKIPPNVQIIPFLQKEELEKEYQSCAMLVLPSRQECWGLVINEAASFGMPIVSTWGSGAAVEFLADDYPQYLAKPGNAEDLLRCIQRCLQANNRLVFSGCILEKTKKYSIEQCVNAHQMII